MSPAVRIHLQAELDDGKVQRRCCARQRSKPACQSDASDSVLELARRSVASNVSGWRFFDVFDG